MAHNSAVRTPNFGKSETMDSSRSRKTKRWVDREGSIHSAISLHSRQDFRDNTILGWISGCSTGGTVLRHARLLASFAFLLTLPSPARADSLSPADHLFREGWALLSEEKFPEARETFGALSPGEYDLGDYVLFFTGFALAREGKLADAAAVHDRLRAPFPPPPPVPSL